jgi:hypothetical protein
MDNYTQSGGVSCTGKQQQKRPPFSSAAESHAKAENPKSALESKCVFLRTSIS